MSGDVAARIAHRLTCSRCRMGWTCGGLGEDDVQNGERIADLVAEAKAEALRDAADEVKRVAADGWGGDLHWLTTGTHVGNLVADVLGEIADEVTA